MTPIVDGLTQTYAAEAAFIPLNAQDGAQGQRAFAASGLPGHPGYLVLTPQGEEVWRGFGQQSAADLQTALDTALAAR